MFLSRLCPHPRDLLVLRDLGDLTEMHRTVMRAFPDDGGPTPRAEFGVLFRVEPQRAEGPGATVLVQSTIEPDWAALPEGYLLEHAVRPMAELLAAVEAGRRFTFRLVANPSKKVGAARESEPRPKHSRRVGLLCEPERIAWLERKGELGGFRLLGSGTDAAAVVADVDPIGRPDRDRIHVRPARFDGLLEVLDADCFRRTLAQGVGPARAYGCGLLSLAAER